MHACTCALEYLNIKSTVGVQGVRVPPWTRCGSHPAGPRCRGPPAHASQPPRFICGWRTGPPARLTPAASCVSRRYCIRPPRRTRRRSTPPRHRRRCPRCNAWGRLTGPPSTRACTAQPELGIGLGLGLGLGSGLGLGPGLGLGLGRGPGLGLGLTSVSRSSGKMCGA